MLVIEIGINVDVCVCMCVYVFICMCIDLVIFNDNEYIKYNNKFVILSKHIINYICI